MKAAPLNDVPLIEMRNEAVAPAVSQVATALASKRGLSLMASVTEPIDGVVCVASTALDVELDTTVV